MYLKILIYDLPRKHQEYLIDDLFEKEINAYFEGDTLVIEKIGTFEEFIDIIYRCIVVSDIEIYIGKVGGFYEKGGK